ncbi:MAG: SufS family cysteine desulfurase [bacterium]|nr:SufS family cysteine desulfurase [bacterium]
MDFAKIKKDFPIFRQARLKKPLVYFDSAATSHKPQSVIDAVVDFYSKTNANTHRAAYELAEQATGKFETVRSLIADWLHIASPDSVIFTKGTTEGINLVAAAWGRNMLKRGDTILLTELEHHANLIPWQLLSREKNLKLEFIPIDDQGRLNLTHLPKLLRGVKLVAFNHVSNALGTINPVQTIVRAARKAGARVLVDGAQAVPHLPVDIGRIDPDFYVFSSHKMLGPSGVGVLYVKPERFEEMTPYQGGGAMISEVHWRHATYQPAPLKFEAGTQPMAQVVGMGAAIEYLQSLGMRQVELHEKQLIRHAYKVFSAIPEVTIYGPKPVDRLGVLTFTVADIHAHDLATLFDEYGICLRAGHHCTQPLHRTLGVTATARFSFYVYNTLKEIDFAAETLKKIIKQWHSPTATS